MIKVEEIFKEFKDVVEEYYTLIGMTGGGQTYLTNVEKDLERRAVKYLRIAKDKYKDRVSKIKNVDSDEFKASIALVENKMAQQTEQLKNLRTTTEDSLKNIILPYLGKGWYFDLGLNCSFVGIENGEYRHICKNAFSINHRYFSYFKDNSYEEDRVFKVKINVFPIDTFDICDTDSKGLKLLKGIIAFERAVKENPIIIEKLKEFTDEYTKMRDELHKLNEHRWKIEVM